jgi:hypothetical protein
LRRKEGEIKLDIPQRRRVLQYLSIFCQFETLWVSKNIEYLEVKENYETLSELIDEKIVYEYRSKADQHPYVSIHQNLAQLVLLALGRKDNELMNNEVDAIKSYIKSPSYPPNRYTILYSIYLTGVTEKSLRAKRILESLWNGEEIFNYIKEGLKDITLFNITFLIKSILFAENESTWSRSEKASQIHESYLELNKEKLKQQFASMSATRIRAKLSYLGYLNFFNFLAEFNEGDYVNIINNSSVNSLRLLFFSIQPINYNLPNFAERLAYASPHADLNLLISPDRATLYRLGGLIGNIAQVKISAAKKFVDKLSEYNLSDLFLKAQFIEGDRTISRINVINLF